MCTGQTEPDTESAGMKQPEVATINELLSAISENEYPQYILDALGTVQDWMNDATAKPDEPDEADIFASIFGDAFSDELHGIDGLFERLEDVGEFADVIPNSRTPEGKPDTIIVSIAPPDYESGLRMAIDYAAVFNRPNCRRVWIISDTFIFDEVIKFSPHVDALSKQGITLRFILVTPWGWVELPLSGATASKHQFLLRTKEELDPKPEEKIRRRRKKQ